MHSEKEGMSMRHLSPFLLAKVLTNEIGSGYKVSKLGSGDLLLEVKDADQCAKLTKITTVGDNPVNITPHRSMNTTRGAIIAQKSVACQYLLLQTNLEAVAV